jgi:hypothetical protein
MRTKVYQVVYTIVTTNTRGIAMVLARL